MSYSCITVTVGNLEYIMQEIHVPPGTFEYNSYRSVFRFIVRLSDVRTRGVSHDYVGTFICMSNRPDSCFAGSDRRAGKQLIVARITNIARARHWMSHECRVRVATDFRECHAGAAHK